MKKKNQKCGLSPLDIASCLRLASGDVLLPFEIAWSCDWEGYVRWIPYKESKSSNNDIEFSTKHIVHEIFRMKVLVLVYFIDDKSSSSWRLSLSFFFSYQFCQNLVFSDCDKQYMRILLEVKRITWLLAKMATGKISRCMTD